MRTQRSVLTASGLRDSIDRINELLGTQHIHLGLPELAAPGTARGWHRCSDLLGTADGFTTWHRELTQWLRQEHGEAPDRTAAGYIRSWYLNAPGFLGALLFHHERRVPSLRPQDVALQIAEDGRPHPVAVALRTDEFACLPGDPAAGTPAATVVDSEQALAALLRARFAGHAARFVAAYRPPVRFGRHTQWGAATDALDIGLWKAGRFGGDEGAGVADAALVLPTALEPFTSASTLRPTCDEDGHLAWTRRRESCCFHYLLSSGSGVCKTCPRLSPPQPG